MEDNGNNGTKFDGKPGPGRPPGSANKVTREIREITRKILLSKSYRRKLRERAQAGELAPAVECMLWAYAFGKPKETVEVNVTHMTAEEAAREIAELEAEARGELKAIDVTPIDNRSGAVLGQPQPDTGHPQRGDVPDDRGFAGSNPADLTKKEGPDPSPK